MPKEKKSSSKSAPDARQSKQIAKVPAATSSSPDPQITAQPAQVQKFLYVEVQQGTSLAAAVERALSIREVPTFTVRKVPEAKPDPACPPPDRLGPNEAIIILCKDEGSNGGG